MSDDLFVTDYRLQHALSGRGFLPGKAAIQDGIQAPADWNRHWLNALSYSSRRLVVINVLGDSITEGNFCTDERNISTGNCYVQLLAKKLQAQYGDGGGGFQNFYNPSLNGTTYTDTAPIVLTGTGITFGTQATPTGTYINLVSVGNAVQTYARGSKVVIWFLRNVSGGIADVTIDGVDKGNVNTAGSNTFLIVEYTGLSNTDHTVVITYASGGSANLNIMGVGGYNASGVVINKLSVPGLSPAKITQSAIQTAYGNQYDNMIGSPFTSGATTPTGLPYLAPDLFINALIVNGQASSDQTTYFNDIMQILQYHRILKPNSMSILQLLPHYGNYKAIYYLMNRATCQQLASMYNCGFLDLSAYLPTGNSWMLSPGYFAVGTSNGAASCPTGSQGQSGIYGTNLNAIHPSDIGHQIMADSIYPVIMATASS